MVLTRRPVIRGALFAGVLFAAAIAAGGCTRKGGPPGAEGADGDEAEAPVPVEVTTIERGRIEETLRFSATLEAETAVQVLARTTGQVRSRQVEEGDQVKQGGVMLRLEREEQASALRRAQTELAQAQRNFRAQEGLHKKGVVSDQTFENAEFDVKRLKIARDDAARALRYTTVAAPIAGTVTQRLVKRGDLVAPNQPLFEIVDFESLVANVYVPEKDIGRVAVGGVARLQAPTTGAMLEDGRVERVAPVVDPRTGTVKVTIALDDTAALRPGMFVDVQLVVADRSDAILLPRRALVYDNDEPYAFKVVDGTTAERVQLQLVAEDEDFVLPESGFAEGDSVVIAGQVGLKNGATVAPQGKGAPPTPPANQEADAAPGEKDRKAPAKKAGKRTAKKASGTTADKTAETTR